MTRSGAAAPLSRDGAGDERDQAAARRDRTGALRDLAAEERDRAAEESEARRRLRFPKRVRRSALARRAAAADRAGSLEDRRAGADDRVNANEDRDASARDRRDAAVDSLTGVARRGAGFLALDREIARARRAGQVVLVGFVDVDHLKEVNDGQGHAAGDQLLVAVADTLRANLRAYDLVFRYGGDEFVCVLAGVDGAFGDSRMALVNRRLRDGAVPASVTAGFAELQPEDSSADLVARADADLYRRREQVLPVQTTARGQATARAASSASAERPKRQM